EKGMSHILETYLKNIDQAQQPAVWVSGFYGSGKSHLVKMLRALWVDTVFEDGATARGIAKLPQGICRSEEHTSELQSRENLVCRLLLEKKKKNKQKEYIDYEIENNIL